MPLNFEKYIHQGEEFVKEVAVELGDPEDKIRAARILRAVLHALRDRIPPAESLQMIAQLPMLIKAFYVDGWKLSNSNRKLRRLGDFIETVRADAGQGARDYFITDYEVEEAICAVFRVLKNHVSEGEIDDIIFSLPPALRPLMVEA